MDYDTFGVSINASKIYASTAPTEIYGEKGTLRCPTVTDIAGVELWDPNTKKSTELGQAKASLNMSEEAEVYAKIIDSKDERAAAELEQLSRATQRITGMFRHCKCSGG